MTAVELGQPGSQAVSPGPILRHANYFYDFTDICLSETPMVHMAQWVGQQGFEAVGTSSNPSLYLHFLTRLLRRKS